jgi:putative ABC transport system permease protein
MTSAEVKENLLVALDTLRSRKVRSALTILGIVIGVTSVISVAAIIDGLNGYIEGRIRNLGSQAIFVTRIPPGYTGLSRLPANIRTRKYLQFDDGRYLMETVSSLSYATAFAQRMNIGEVSDQLRYGNQHVERMIVRGVEPDLPMRCRYSRWPRAALSRSSIWTTPATWSSSAWPLPTPCFHTSTRSARWSA